MIGLFDDKFPREMAFPVRSGEDRIVHNIKEFCSAINKHNGRLNVYTTIYGFDKTIKNKYGQEIPDYDSAIIDKIYFDLDNTDSFEKIKQLHEFLLKKDLKHCLIFSGGGFHCYVKCKKILAKNPKGLIENLQNKIALGAGLTIGEPKECDIDWHVRGDLKRISRVPNTYNIKRKCFCIPIRKEDLYINNDFKSIKAIAKTQRNIKVKWYGKKEINSEKFDVESKSRPSYNSDIGKEIIDCEDFGEEQLWPCVKIMLTEHTDHRKRYWGIIWLREMGYSEEEAKKICCKYLSKYERRDGTKNDYNHMIVHDHTFETVYRKGEHYFPKCEKLYDEGLCKGKCKHYNKVYLERGE